jgi:predicted DNA binding CopG/RHH family protein
MKKLKNIPKFQSEKEESDFWQKNDSTQYIDYSKVDLAFFPNLKPSLKTISIRLPEPLINALKILANKSDVPYQSLMKIYLGEKITAEFNKVKAK